MDKLRLASSVRDLTTRNLWLSLVAEFIGTFLLVFIGFGSAYNNMNPVKLGLGFGLAGAVIIYCIGPVSGGNINPAVSFGLLVARKISFIRWVLYSIIQIIGATVGFGFILFLTNGTVLEKSYWKVNMNLTHKFVKFNGTPNFRTEELTIRSPINGRLDESIIRIDPPIFKILCEVVITFVLVFTVMRLCVEKSRSATEKGLAPLIIGVSITIGVYCGMNISGGSMNPAASLGKWLFKKSRGVSNHIIGPMIGGFLAGFLQQTVFTSELSSEYIKRYLFDPNFDEEELKQNKKLENIQMKDIEKQETVDKHKTEEQPKDDGKKVEKKKEEPEDGSNSLKIEQTQLIE